MTLFKKMTLMFSLFFLTILALVLAINFSESKEYVQDELYAKAVNGSATLAVSMSQSGGDVVKLSTIADAVFDTGYFRKIELKDMRGRSLFVKTKERSSAVPKWFLTVAALKAPKAAAQVSAGWKPLGILEVTSDTSLAEEYLYSLFLKLIGLFLVLGIAGIALIALLVRSLLEPIKKLRIQAEGVLRNRFSVNEERSSIAEIDSVTEVMNRLVGSMEQMHDRLLQLTRKNAELEYRDRLTSLFNRRYFIIKYEEYINGGHNLDNGAVVVMRLCGTKSANSIVGYDVVDGIFREIALKGAETVNGREESVAVRLSGIEALYLLPGVASDKAKEAADRALAEAREIVDGYDEVKEILYVCVAVVHYGKEKSLEELLASVDLALEDARSQNRDCVKTVEYEKRTPTRKSLWRSLLSEAFDRRRLIPVCKEMGGEKAGRPDCLVTFDLPLQNGDTVPYEIYAPMLGAVGLLERYLHYALERVVEDGTFVNKKAALPITLSFLDTTHEMDRLLESAKRLDSCGRGLVAELAQNDILKYETRTVERLVQKLKRGGVDVGISGFDADEKMLELLKTVQPLYLKMGATRFLDMSDSFRESLMLLVKSVESLLYIENVESEELRAKIERLGCDVEVL
ncbi:GGDEF and EAL domain proteins [Hydrogenimonas sp.]|nr:GGDEF and EAL domain proteins [Hydrogenimonas sp.]